MSSAGGGGAPQRAVLWFRNDLRLHDNAIVAEAAQAVKNGKLSEVGSASLAPSTTVFICLLRTTRQCVY